MNFLKEIWLSMICYLKQVVLKIPVDPITNNSWKNNLIQAVHCLATVISSEMEPLTILTFTFDSKKFDKNKIQ